MIEKLSPDNQKHTNVVCHIAMAYPTFKNTRTASCNRDHRQQGQLAPRNCSENAPSGLLQNVETRTKLRQAVAAGKHKFEQKVATVEDTCVDAWLVAQNTKFVV